MRPEQYVANCRSCLQAHSSRVVNPKFPYQKIDTFSNGTPYGFWTFIYENPGVDLNIPTGIDNSVVENKRLIKVVDILGRENNGERNKLLLFIYDDGTTEKKTILK